MPELTFFPLGNADCCLIDLDTGKKLLFDYANCRDAADDDDPRIDLATVLRDDLDDAGRDWFDVVAITHLDDDHVHGAAEFFFLDHDEQYQGDGRIEIRELWVPAAIIVDDNDDLSDDAKIIQAEARHRLRAGAGIRVFSRPALLEGWLDDEGIDLEDVQGLLTDAGDTVPGFAKSTDGVEFFVHSPFAERVDGELIDRNACSLVMQATFAVGSQETCLILSADTPCDDLAHLVDVTLRHRNADRLVWDVVKLPHHCSYTSLSNEKGEDETVPLRQIKWLFETQGAARGVVVSTSDPIPTQDTDQPPHRQAANYYRRRVAAPKNGQFVVTMEHPSVPHPEPLVIRIDAGGATVEKRNRPGAAAIVSRPVRAG